MRYGSFFLLLLLACSACSEKEDRPSHPQPVAKPDSTIAIDTAGPAMPGAGGVPESNEHRLFKLYAQLATRVPHKVLDSLLHNQKNPAEIESAMKGYLQHRDTLVRRLLAKQNGISVDSLDAIIDRGNAGKW